MGSLESDTDWANNIFTFSLYHTDIPQYVYSSSVGRHLGLFPVSVQFSRSVVSDSLQPHELQQARPPCSSPTPGVYPNPCPLSQWCHPTISSSVIPFSSCPQSFPASGSFQMSQLFMSGGQNILAKVYFLLPDMRAKKIEPDLNPYSQQFTFLYIYFSFPFFFYFYSNHFVVFIPGHC